MKKRGIIPIVALIAVMLVFEALVIFVFNFTGIFRSIFAAVIGGAAFEIGKNLESKLIKSESQSLDNKLLNIIAFVIIFIFIVGMNLLKNNNSSTNDSISKNVVVSKTNKHIHVPTTKIYIVPPLNFNFIKDLLRFQKDNKTYFQIVEMQDADFAKNELNRNNLESKGAKILLWREFLLNDIPAKFVKIQADFQNNNMFLAFGDSHFSVMIIGYYPIGDTVSENEIQKSLLSIYYDKLEKVNPFEFAKFKIELSDNDYKFARYASNVYIFTEDGKIDEKNPFKSQFMISQVPSVGLAYESMQKYSFSLISSWESSGVPKISVTKSRPTLVNGFYGYLTIGETKHQLNNIAIYLLVITDVNTTIAFSGVASGNIKKELEMFDRVSNTIKITTANTINAICPALRTL